MSTDVWGFPFSLFAGFAVASIGAHFMERALKTDDEWARFACLTLTVTCGLLANMEALKVWQELGLTHR